VVWLVGLVIEVVADGQKAAFRKDAANKGRFIDSGVWAWSRHPNYFGEILVWVGVAIVAAGGRRLAVGHRDLAAVRDPSADAGERHPDAGEARRRALG
jgi:steroid 5-alpha reductase family enzyme